MNKRSNETFRVTKTNGDLAYTDSVGDRAEFYVSDSNAPLSEKKERFNYSIHKKNPSTDSAERSLFTYGADVSLISAEPYENIYQLNHPNLNERILNKSIEYFSDSLISSDNIGLESTGEVTRAAGKTLSRFKEIVYISKRNTRGAQGKAQAATRNNALGTANTNTSLSLADSSGFVVFISIAVPLIITLLVSLLVSLFVLISIHGAVLVFPNGFYWPLEKHRYVSSPFGNRKEIYVNGRWTGPFHSGIDIPAPQSTPIGATAPGVVKTAEKGSAGYGNYVLIVHDDNYESLYAHMNDIFVETGQYIFATEIIGTVGSTGTSTGYHLHFEILLFGYPIDPLNFEYMDWSDLYNIA